MAERAQRGPITQLLRLLRYRLVIPVKRSRAHPREVARAVFIGLLVGLTPTVGVQMLVVTAIWGFLDGLCKWRFTLLVAIAWSWVSNPVSMFPLYYLFFLVGELMLGTTDSGIDFAQFNALFEKALQGDAGSLWDQLVLVAETFGLPVVVGCVPFMLVFAPIGYVLTYRYLMRARERRQARAHARVAGP